MADQKISELTALTTPASGDEFPLNDTSASTTKKITFTNIESNLNHDALTNFVSGEHFLQSAITVVGTITTGIWNGTDIAVVDGGTGAGTAAGARTNLGVDAAGTDNSTDVTVTDSAEIDFTLTGQDLTASLIAGSIDETKLDTSTNASLDLADSALQNIVEDATPELGGELDAGANSIGFTAQTATGDGTTTIDWGNGNKFNFQFGAFNETFTFTAPAKPGNFVLKLVQDSVGSRTATWPASVKWSGGSAPTLTTTATTGTDIISFYFDGTNYFGGSILNFS